MENGSDRVVFQPVIHTDIESVEKARKIVLEIRPEVVAVELDKTRYHMLLDPDPAQEEAASIPSGDVIQNMLNQISNLERNLGSMTGSVTGTEMLVAIEAGKGVGAKIALVDRPIEATAQAMMQIPLDEIYKFTGVIPGASDDLEENDAEEIMSMLKEDGAVEDLMENFRTEFPSLARVLIDERDEYIAKALKSIMGDVKGKIVAVLGAGHIDGVKATLNRLLDADESS
ncbi:MAG: TraB domain-containing protein [Candidatus Thorarchaeota archaeon]